MSTGLCRHCGKPDAPVGPTGYIDRHHRADWIDGPGRGNELCFGNLADLRPGDPCTCRLATCLDAKEPTP